MKYFRISPSTKFWMYQLNYTENDLPKDKRVINKYVLLEAIKKGIKKNPSIEAAKSKENIKSNIISNFPS